MTCQKTRPDNPYWANEVTEPGGIMQNELIMAVKAKSAQASQADDFGKQAA